jgi:hypothetical protein
MTLIGRFSAGHNSSQARFAYRDDRLAEVGAAAERLADARDEVRPRTSDERPGA